MKRVDNLFEYIPLRCEIVLEEDFLDCRLPITFVIKGMLFSFLLLEGFVLLLLFPFLLRICLFLSPIKPKQSFANSITFSFYYTHG